MKSSPLMRLLARSLLVTLLVSLGISLGWSGPLAPAAAATSYGLVRTYLKPNAEAGDDFGRSVAWVGANVLVGAPQPNSATSPGEAYLLDRLTGADLALFIEPSPAPGEKFGSSVALAGDRVIIGTPDEGTLALQAGAAYLFGSDGAPLHSFTNPGVPPITFDTF
ncbi:MAG: FG-GAP repeat protein, partial [Anaerolineales bacterium]